MIICKVLNNNLMKIAITGGSGFIGTNLASLLSKNHIVKILDITKNSNNQNEFFKIDILDLDSLIKYTKNMDVVIHLAASLGVVNTETNPISTLTINSIGTKNVLEASYLNGVSKIILSSSSEVYGEPDKIPISENDLAKPITTYGISKLCSEEYVKAYFRQYNLEYTIFRLFNVYGIFQGKDWVVPEFINKAVNDETIIIHGDGSQVRAFCNVSDITNAFELALPKNNNDIFNIGNPMEPISIKTLAEKIISLSNSKSKIQFIPFSKSFRNRIEIMNRSPNIEKARTKLGYEPKINLDEGLRISIEHFKKNH